MEGGNQNHEGLPKLKKFFQCLPTTISESSEKTPPSSYQRQVASMQRYQRVQ